MRFVGTISVFGPPLDFLNATMPGTEYTFSGDGLVSQGTVATGPAATQIYTTSYTGGTINVYADPTPDAVFEPFPPNGLVPSTFENDPPPILTGTFTRFVVTTNNFTAFQTGNIEGDINWTGGTMIDKFRASSGAICPGLFMTDINREWNEKRPDVIAEFVRHIPMGRPGEPDEIGPLAVYLASPASQYVTGAAYVIDGGYTVW